MQQSQGADAGTVVYTHEVTGSGPQVANFMSHSVVRYIYHYQVRLQLGVVGSEGNIHPLAQHVQLILRSTKFEGTGGKQSTKFQGTGAKRINP